MLKAEIRQLLVDHYLDFYALAYSMLNNESDARDAVQEALTRTLSKRHLDDPLSYCYQAVRHAAIDIMRYRKRFVPLEETILMDAVRVPLNSYQTLLEERALLMRDNLPEVQRELVVMHDEDGLSYADISRMTGKSTMTIRRLLKKAHATLRKGMNQKKETTI